MCCPRTVPHFHKLLSESQEVAREGRTGCLLLTAGGWMGMVLHAAFQTAVPEPKGGKGSHMRIPSKKSSTARAKPSACWISTFPALVSMPFGLGEVGVKVLLSGAVQSELFEGYQQSQKFLASAFNSKLSWLSSGFLTYPIVPELPSCDNGYWFLKERQ